MIVRLWQSTRSQCRLVEILGRFVCSVYIVRWNSSKPNVSKLFKTAAYRLDLLLCCMHLEVKLGWFTSRQVGIHTWLRARWGWFALATSTSDWSSGQVLVHTDYASGHGAWHVGIWKTRQAVLESARSHIVWRVRASYIDLGWVKVGLRADWLPVLLTRRRVSNCFITSCLDLTVTITSLHELVHKFAAIALEASTTLADWGNRILFACPDGVCDWKLAALRVLSGRVN